MLKKYNQKTTIRGANNTGLTRDLELQVNGSAKTQRRPAKESAVSSSNGVSNQNGNNNTGNAGESPHPVPTQSVSSTAYPVMDNNNDNAGVESGPPQIDLMQVYPSFTNNLDIINFNDDRLRYIEEANVVSDSCPVINNVLLFINKYILELLFGLLVIVALLLGIASMVIVINLVSDGDDYYYSDNHALYFGPIVLALFLLKLYLIRKLYLFIKFRNSFDQQQRSMSYEYHRLGLKWYYLLYGDMVFCSVFALWRFMEVWHFCVWGPFLADVNDADHDHWYYEDYDWYCDYRTELDYYWFWGVTTWFMMVPFIIYVFFVYFLVFFKYDSKSNNCFLHTVCCCLDKSLFCQQFNEHNSNYFEQNLNIISYNFYKQTNDIRYCVNYYYANGNSHKDIYIDEYDCMCCSSKCTHCTKTNNDSCCGSSNNDCCNNNLKCSLIAISVWQCIVSILGLFFVYFALWYIDYAIYYSERFESNNYDSSDEGYYFFRATWYWFWALQLLFYGFGLIFYHIMPAYYSFRFVCYKRRCCHCCDCECCSNGSNNDNNSGGDGSGAEIAARFQEYSVKAMKAYSALAVVYWIAFIIYLVIIIVVMFVYEYFGIHIGILIASSFIAWLPIEALKLIDKIIQIENYRQKQHHMIRVSPNPISMDRFTARLQQFQSNANGNNSGNNNIAHNNGSSNAKNGENNNNNNEDDNIVSALQVVSRQKSLGDKI